MAESHATSSDTVHLSFRSQTKVMVEADNEDRFFTTVREAAHACKKAEDDKAFQHDFREFLIRLEKWASDHSAQVDSVFVNVGDGSLNVLVGTKQELYNVDLDDTITDLDIALVKEFPWLVAEVMQVPASVIKSARLPFQKTIVVYGDGK